MATREEALRRILEATGASARLTEEQRREILTHLDDSIDAKVREGKPEMEAVAVALEEMGDLAKIARQFPENRAVAVTPEGWFAWASTPGAIVSAYAILVFFILLQVFVTPKFFAIFQSAQVPVPGVTLFFMSMSDAMVAYWPAFVVAFLLVSWGLVRLNRARRLPAAASVSIAVTAAAFCVGLMAALTLPLTALLQGVGR